ncbi:hypothetical protein JHN63_17995 [Streptomyces sp. MBT65]|uniref:hypothetical protein n=1 Tax=Streptomyces sp. MBT65 TaxID=1488395 RepID=UPI00190C463B|nr:hypothetical protein [Streptomyces sp. MBT65]MBK3575673.1 hypothetical protein [Streptomyces sp. MBT65]
MSAVTEAALSVLRGMWILGDRPTAPAWLSLGVALSTLWLASGAGARRKSRAAGAQVPADGLAGPGIAVHYIGLTQADSVSGPQLVARGSWLVARGSWLVARGSWLPDVWRPSFF